MNFITIFFGLMSLFVFLYIFYIFKTNKRLSLLLEVFYLGIYGIMIFISIFPKILKKIEQILGLSSAINFIVYFSIFVSYLLILMLYRKTEKQRIEITKLVREISYLKNEKK